VIVNLMAAGASLGSRPPRGRWSQTIARRARRSAPWSSAAAPLAGRRWAAHPPVCATHAHARTHAQAARTHRQHATHVSPITATRRQAGRQAGRQPSGSGTTPCTRHTTTRARPCTAGLLLRLRLAISARLPPLPRRQNTMGTHQRVEQALNPAGGRHVGRLRTRRPCPAVSALNIS
jgi:hypothetical protein